MHKNTKVLFFGRKNCLYSKRMIKELKKFCNKINIVLSNKPNEKISKKILKWKGEYIFCFRSYFLLKETFLKKASIAAINFHPGPPEYRGIGCVNFSILNSEKFYGVTSHLMSKNIDKGKIIDVKRFKIRKNDNISSILTQSYKLQLIQFKKIIKKLCLNPNNLTKMIKNSNKEKWSKKIYTRSNLNNLYKMNIGYKIKISNIQTYLKSTMTKKFKPYIELNKKKYFLLNEK